MKPTGPERDSDGELVTRARAGELDAFEQLVCRYEKRIYALAAHSGLVDGGPDDVVQETMIQAYRKLGTLRQPDRFGSWLYRIALRLCGTMRTRPERSGVQVEELAIAAGGESASQAEAGESRIRVREAVAALPDTYRLAVTLRFFEGMACDQIADHLGVPVGTIWTRLHRANSILRGKLGSLQPSRSGGTR